MGDLPLQLAKRYEKPCGFAQAAFVTILSVTTMPGNGVTHPVPDNTSYVNMTNEFSGHIVYRLYRIAALEHKSHSKYCDLRIPYCSTINAVHNPGRVGHSVRLLRATHP